MYSILFFSYRRKTDEVFDRVIQNTLTVKISSVKKLHRLKVTKFFKDFVTFQRRNFLIAFSDREQNKFYLYFILFVFDLKIKLI